MSIRTTGVRYDVIARDSASKVFKGIGGQAGKLDGTIGKLAKGAAVAGAAIAGGLAFGLAKSAKDAVDFEANMKKVQTQAGGSAKDVKVLSGQVLNLGKSTQQGPEALADSMYHLKSVGLDNVSAMKDLKVASDLAAVGGSDLEETTNALAGAWRSGIKGAESFGKSAATVNAIIGAGNMRMEDFVAAIGTGILPSAKSFGLSLQSVGSALALMTDEGIPAVDAATRLRMSLSLLGAPSDKAEDQLKRIGLTGTSLAKEMRSPAGLVGAIGLLKTSLDKSGLSAVQQSQLISKAFGGGRSSSGILTLLNNYDVLVKKQNQVNASMGKFPAAVAAQRKTAAAQLALIKSNFEVFSIKTGNVLLPPLTRFVTYLNQKAIPEVVHFGQDMVDRFIPVDRIKSGFSTVQGLVSDFVSGLKPPPKKHVVTLPTPTVKVPQSKIPEALRKPYVFTVPSPTVKPAQTKIPSMLKAITPPKSDARKLGEQVRGLISGGIGDAVGKISWGKVGKTVVTGLGKAADWVVANGADLSKKVGKAIGGIDWVDVGKEFGGIALPLAIGFVNNLFAPLFTVTFWKKHWLDFILAAVSFIPFGDVLGPVGDFFKGIPWGKLGEVLDHVPWGRIFGWADHITKPIGEATAATGRFITRLGSSFTSGFSRMFPKIGQFFSDQLYILPDRLGDAGRALSRKGSKVIDDLGEAIKKRVPLLGSKFVQAVLKVWGRFTLYQSGIHLVEGLLSGINAEMQGIGKWIENHIVDPVVNWVKNLFGIHSPSTVFASVGRFLISGLLGGLLDGMSGVGKWIDNHMVYPVLAEFAGAGSWLYSKGSSLVSGLKSGAWDVAKGIGGWVRSNVADKVTGVFKAAKNWLYTPGKALLSGLKSGLIADMKGIGGWLKSSLVDPIVNAVKHWFGIKSPSKVFAGIGGHLVSGLVQGLATSSGLDIAKTVFGDLPSALASIVGRGLVSITKLPGKALSALSSVGGQAEKLFGNLFGGGGGGGSMVGQWATDVRTVLSMLGASPEALSPVLTRIGIESGGNPKAINLTDSNAIAGHPSQGLMQTIPSTFNTYAGPLRGRGITDPLANIYAGVNYAMHRYGANWTKIMTRPGGYAAGGLAPFGQTAWVGERGAELMQVTARGTRIYNHKDSMALAKSAGIRLPGYAGGTTSVSAAAAAESRIQREVNRLEAALKGAQHDRLTARTKAQRHADALEVEAAQRRLDAAKADLTAAKKRLSAAQAQAKRVSTVSNTLSNGFLRTLETSTAAGIAGAVKSMNSKLQAAGAGSMVAGNLRTSSKLQALATQKASIASRIATAKQYSADQASSLSDFLSVGDTSATSISGLLTQMKAGQTQAKNFANLTSSLSNRGLSKTLLSELADQGPGSQLASILGHASDGDIAQLNKVAASQSKLTVSFGKQMADAMYDSGSQAGKGFLTGLVAQEAALQKEMDKLATGMVNAIKKRLGIKSPSTVARDQLGKQFAHGVALGVRLHAPAATAEAQRMADTMAAVRARATGRITAPPQTRPSGNGGSSEPCQLTGDLYLDSGEFLGVVKGVVAPMLRQSEKKQAHRAKVGSAR